ncbi:hypothetical protein BUALT_Bualt04G0100900 [Buddleja alternifolia]|uniref:Uncharacterized protein n=1 Tax=Buddleja alternifolia TaxID=168488 RepID=A0AAV6XYY6_9LAMI|nr:hypothetical protein BUALT_Bualt04G0100900 [Buddleja alternifolia]
MSRSTQTAIPFVLLLLSITLVFGSTVSDRIAKRPDPLRKFKHYGEDYDIRSKHYWASAAFTGIHGYAMAGLWLLFGIGYGISIVIRNLCGSKSPTVDHPNFSYLIIFLLLVLFSMFAMIASGVIIAANQKSLQRTKMLEETMFGAGDDASQTMGKVKISLINMQNNLRPYDSKTCDLLDLITRQLRKESLNIRNYVDNTKKYCDQAIQALYVVNLVVVSVNLAFLVAGLPCSFNYLDSCGKHVTKQTWFRLMDCCFGSVLLILHYRPGILILIFSCWILTTLSWILTGFDFFFYTFIGDTCSALKNFEEKPENNSLTDMLPCPKSTDYDETLGQINDSVHNFIDEVNSKILEIREVIATNEENDDQSIPKVCDPFSSAPNYSYSPENCGKDSMPVQDLPNVLSRFTCYAGNTSKNCVAEGKFLPESIYDISFAYSESIKDLINIYPDLLGLMQCSSVKQAFSNIVARQCRPIELSTQVLWSSTLTLSLVMMVLVLLWSEKDIQDRGRCFNRWSIFPRPIQRG